MEIREKIELVSKLKELVSTGELDVYNANAENNLQEKNIRTIFMKGDVITIYLSESQGIEMLTHVMNQGFLCFCKATG